MAKENLQKERAGSRFARRKEGDLVKILRDAEVKGTKIKMKWVITKFRVKDSINSLLNTR